MKIKNIILTLANHEVVSIDGRYVGDFHVAEMQHMIERHGLEVDDHIVIGEFYMEAAKLANCEFVSANHSGGKYTCFERLTEKNDIYMIQFSMVHAIAGIREYTCFPVWDSERGENNNNQISYISDLGNLYIAIGNKTFTGRAIDMKSVNNKLIIKKKFQLYNI